MAVSSVAQQRSPMRFRGRSYMAFALTPEPPIVDWLSELDNWIRSSAGFFVGRPVVLDLTAVTLTTPGHCPSDRRARVPQHQNHGDRGHRSRQARTGAAAAAQGRPRGDRRSRRFRRRQASRPPPARKEPSSLLLETPVRSGQSVFFPDGDVTVLGSVGSGAEVIAGGSIHIYGTLRGRAMAGMSGNRQARIFCSKIEAELLAIDGFYRTAEDLDLRCRDGSSRLGSTAKS